MAQISDRIKALRKAAGLTQTEFGELFGLAVNTVSQYELGMHSPNDDVKIAIANHFNVSMDYLMGKTDNPEMDSKTPSVFASKMTAETIEAIHAYSELSSENQRRVEDYIRILTEWEKYGSACEKRKALQKKHNNKRKKAKADPDQAEDSRSSLSTDTPK